MDIKKKIENLENRIANKFDDYKKEHPGTHKTPSDPMFKEVEDRLAKHDWFHEMADRNEDLQNGRRDAAEIGSKLKHLPYEHAKALVDKHSHGKAEYKPEHHAKGTYWDVKY